MATFYNKWKLTKFGEMAMTDAPNRKPTIHSISIGSGYTASFNYYEAETLADVKNTYKVLRHELRENDELESYLRLDFYITNVDDQGRNIVPNPYRINEIGIYILDETGSPKLFAYTVNTDNTGEMMLNYEDGIASTVVGIKFVVDMAISNKLHLNVKIDTADFETKKALFDRFYYDKEAIDQKIDALNNRNLEVIKSSLKDLDDHTVNREEFIGMVRNLEDNIRANMTDVVSDRVVAKLDTLLDREIEDNLKDKVDTVVVPRVEGIITEKINGNNTIIDGKINDAKNDSKASVQALRTELSAVDEGLQRSIDGINNDTTTKINKVKESIVETNTKIEDLNTEFTSYKQSNDGEISAIKRTNETQDRTISSNYDEFTRFKNDYETDKTSNGEKLVQINNSITGVSDKVDALKGELLTKISTSVGDFKTNIDDTLANSTTITGINGEIRGIKTNIGTIESTVVNNKTELVEKIDGLETKLDNKRENLKRTLEGKIEEYIKNGELRENTLVLTKGNDGTIEIDLAKFIDTFDLSNSTIKDLSLNVDELVFTTEGDNVLRVDLSKYNVPDATETVSGKVTLNRIDNKIDEKVLEASNAIESKIDNIKGDIRTLTTETTSLRQGLTSAQGDVVSIGTRVTTLEGNPVSPPSTYFDTLNNDITTLKRAKDDLTTLTGRVDNMDSTTTRKLSELETKITTLSSDVNNAGYETTAEVDRKLNEKNQLITQNKNLIDALNNWKANLAIVESTTYNEKIRELEGKITTNTSTIDSNNSALGTRIDNIKNSLDTNTGNITTIQGDVRRLSGLINGMSNNTQNITELTTGLSEVKRDHGTLLARYNLKENELDTKVGKLEAKDTELAKKIETLENANTTRDSSDTQFRDSINNWKTEWSSTDNQKSRFKTNFKDFFTDSANNTDYLSKFDEYVTLLINNKSENSTWLNELKSKIDARVLTSEFNNTVASLRSSIEAGKESVKQEINDGINTIVDNRALTVVNNNSYTKNSIDTKVEEINRKIEEAKNRNPFPSGITGSDLTRIKDIALNFDRLYSTRQIPTIPILEEKVRENVRTILGDGYADIQSGHTTKIQKLMEDIVRLKEALGETDGDSSGDSGRPRRSLDDFATKEELDNKFGEVDGKITTALGSSGFLRSTDLIDYVRTNDLNDYARRSDLNGFANASDLSRYALASELNNVVRNADLSRFATKDEIADVVRTNTLGNYVRTDAITDVVRNSTLDNYVPRTELSNYVTTASLNDVVRTNTLNDYVTRTSINNVVRRPDLANYATVTSLNEYARNDSLTDVVRTGTLTDYVPKTEMSKYALTTALNDVVRTGDLADYVNRSTLNNYITRSSISDVVRRNDLSDYATTVSLDEYVTKSELNSEISSLNLSNYATNASLSDVVRTNDLGTYALKTEIPRDTVTNNAMTTHVTTALRDYATVASLNDVVRRPDLSTYALKTEIPTDIVDTQEMSTFVTDQLRNYAPTSEINRLNTAVSGKLNTSELDSKVRNIAYIKSEIDTKISEINRRIDGINNSSTSGSSATPANTNVAPSFTMEDILVKSNGQKFISLPAHNTTASTVRLKRPLTDFEQITIVMSNGVNGTGSLHSFTHTKLELLKIMEISKSHNNIVYEFGYRFWMNAATLNTNALAVKGQNPTSIFAIYGYTRT